MKKLFYALLLCVFFVFGCSKSPSVTPTAVKTATVNFYGFNAGYAANGPLASASFYGPHGIVTDATGNIYIADFENNIIRKITADGVVSTYAGNGKVGNIDGNASSAEFNGPVSLAIDGSGNLYVADVVEDIRKITQAGIVSTIAEVTGILSVAVDASGNLYAGINLGFIDKITPSGIVTRYAGKVGGGYQDGPVLSAGFSTAAGMAFDKADDLYVADNQNNLIRKITPAGIVSTVAGNLTVGSVDGTGISASLNSPIALTFDSNENLYVVEYSGHKIRKITPAGVVTTVAGNGDSNGQLTSGPALTSSLGTPTGIAFDLSNNLYFTSITGAPIGKISF